MVKIPNVSEYIRLGMRFGNDWSWLHQRKFLIELFYSANPELRSMNGNLWMIRCLDSLWIGKPDEVAKQLLFFCSIFERGGEFVAKNVSVTDWDNWLQYAEKVLKSRR